MQIKSLNKRLKLSSSTSSSDHSRTLAGFQKYVEDLVGAYQKGASAGLQQGTVDLIRDYLVQLWQTFIKEHDRDLKVKEWCGVNVMAALAANYEGGAVRYNTATKVWETVTVTVADGEYCEACSTAKGLDGSGQYVDGHSLKGNATAAGGTLPTLQAAQNDHEQCRVDRFKACTHTTCRHFDAYRGVKDGAGQNQWEWTNRPNMDEFDISNPAACDGASAPCNWENYRMSAVRWLAADPARKKTMLPKGWSQHSNRDVSDDTLVGVVRPHYLPSCAKDACGGGVSCFGPTYLKAGRVDAGSVRTHGTTQLTEDQWEQVGRSVATGVGIVPNPDLFSMEKCLRTFKVWLGPGRDCLKDSNFPWADTADAIISVDDQNSLWNDCVGEAEDQQTEEIPGMWPLYQACKASRSETEAKDSECNTKQGTFEAAHCSHYQLLGFHCYELDKCIQAETEACGTHHDTVAAKAKSVCETPHHTAVGFCTEVAKNGVDALSAFGYASLDVCKSTKVAENAVECQDLSDTGNLGSEYTSIDDCNTQKNELTNAQCDGWDSDAFASLGYSSVDDCQSKKEAELAESSSVVAGKCDDTPNDCPTSGTTQGKQVLGGKTTACLSAAKTSWGELADLNDVDYTAGKLPRTSTCGKLEERWRQRQTDNETAEHIDCLLAALTSALETTSGATDETDMTLKNVEQDDVQQNDGVAALDGNVTHETEADYRAAKRNKERANAALGFCRGDIWRAKAGTVSDQEGFTAVYKPDGALNARGWTHEATNVESDLEIAVVYDYFKVEPTSTVSEADAVHILATNGAKNFYEELKPKRLFWVIPCGAKCDEKCSVTLEPPPCTAGQLEFNDNGVKAKGIGFKSRYYSLLVETPATGWPATAFSSIQGDAEGWKSPSGTPSHLEDNVERWFSAEREFDQIVCEGPAAAGTTFPVREGSFSSNLGDTELKWCKLGSVFHQGTYSFGYPRSPAVDTETVQDSKSSQENSWHSGDADILNDFALQTAASKSYQEWKERACWDVAACDATLINEGSFSMDRFSQAKCHSYYHWHHDLAWDADQIKPGHQNSATARVGAGVGVVDAFHRDRETAGLDAGTAHALAGDSNADDVFVTGVKDGDNNKPAELDDLTASEKGARDQTTRDDFDEVEDITDEEKAAAAAAE